MGTKFEEVNRSGMEDKQPTSKSSEKVSEEQLPERDRKFPSKVIPGETVRCPTCRAVHSVYENCPA